MTKVFLIVGLLLVLIGLFLTIQYIEGWQNLLTAYIWMLATSILFLVGIALGEKLGQNQCIKRKLPLRNENNL